MSTHPTATIFSAPGTWFEHLSAQTLARVRLREARAVLFDLDDTLINWRQAEHGAIGDLARLHFADVGVAEATVRAHYDQVMAENYAAWKATRHWWYVSDRLRLLVGRLGVQDRLDVALLSESFSREVAARLDYLDGALGALRAARRPARRTAILTNGRGEVQRPKVNAFKLDLEVDFVGITGELGAWKPDPEAFLRVLRRLDVRPEEAVMVGDNLDFDIQPARALGMGTVWVNPLGQLSEHADLVVPTPGALLPHLA